MVGIVTGQGQPTIEVEPDGNPNPRAPERVAIVPRPAPAPNGSATSQSIRRTSRTRCPLPAVAPAGQSHRMSGTEGSSCPAEVQELIRSVERNGRHQSAVR